MAGRIDKVDRKMISTIQWVEGFCVSKPLVYTPPLNISENVTHRPELRMSVISSGVVTA